MTDNSVPVLDASELRRLAQAQAGPGCPTCSAIKAPGWEAMPGSFDREQLRKVGTLRQGAVEDPTLQEYHPQGSHAWSPDAPIAPEWFPYNRCEVWACVACDRPFLRYTEYGGYYIEERVRELHAEIVAVDAPAPPR